MLVGQGKSATDEVIEVAGFLVQGGKRCWKAVLRMIFHL
jgi:hypothetical protein